MNKTINIYTALYPPSIGGVQRYSYHLAQECRRNGYRVNVITSAADGRAAIREEDGITVRTLSTIHLFGGRLPIPYSVYEWYRLFKDYHVGTRPVITIAQTRFFPLTLIAAILSCLCGSRIGIIDHGAAHISAGGRLMSVTIAVYEHVVTSVLKCFKPRCFAVSHAAAGWLRHFGIVCDGVVSNAVHEVPEDLRHSETRRASTEAVPKILCISRLVPEKGLIALLDGFKEFQRRGFEARLVIAGDGPMAEEISRIAARDETINFVGLLSKEAVRSELLSCAVFINPSLRPEGLPTILLEAGILGVPVISTPGGGSAEIIKDHKTGLLVDVSSPAQIADALERMMALPNKGSALGIALQCLIRERYLWPKVTTEFLRLVEGVSWSYGFLMTPNARRAAKAD